MTTIERRRSTVCTRRLAAEGRRSRTGNPDQACASPRFALHTIPSANPKAPSNSHSTERFAPSAWPKLARVGPHSLQTLRHFAGGRFCRKTRQGDAEKGVNPCKRRCKNARVCKTAIGYEVASTRGRPTGVRRDSAGVSRCWRTGAPALIGVRGTGRGPPISHVAMIHGSVAPSRLSRQGPEKGPEKVSGRIS